MFGPRFSTEYMISKFAESVTVSRPLSGEVLYYSNKLTEATGTTSVTMGEIRAGVGNPIVAVIPSDSNATLEITDVNLSLAMRAYQTGGLHGYGAPTLVCDDITASDGKLSISAAAYGTPVAGQGFSEAFAYVQENGAQTTITGDGVPYAINASNEVSGFTAEDGKTYKVWYWVNAATTEYATILANIDPTVVNVRLVYPVYSNVKEDGTGSRIGSLVVVYPFLKLNGSAGITGNGSSNATTSISGTAISFEESTVQAGCGACTDGSADLVHYLYVPCDNSVSAIQGMYVLGGVYDIQTGTSGRVPLMLMVNGYPAAADPAFLTCTTEDTPPTGTTLLQDGRVNAGSTEGTFDARAEYVVNGNTVASCNFGISVSAAK